MEKYNYQRCLPYLSEEENVETPNEPLLNLNSGYITRSSKKFPKQGLKTPWKYYQNFLRDVKTLRFGSVADGVMKFF